MDTEQDLAKALGPGAVAVFIPADNCLVRVVLTVTFAVDEKGSCCSHLLVSLQHVGHLDMYENGV